MTPPWPTSWPPSRPTRSPPDAPVVRLVGGTGIPGRGLLDGALDDIPGLGPSAVTAASVSVETRPLESLLAPYVSAGGSRERARLYGDDDLVHSLVPVASAPAGARRRLAPGTVGGQAVACVPATPSRSGSTPG